MQARARTLKERSNIPSTRDAHNNNDNNNNKEAHGDVKFKPKEDHDEGNAGEMFSMDYTPARRKPPIHN
ncbi:hypothetical protein RIF29_42400 [Crotalaria pallida]|uniref:Uncharacterized protein n=1 Tax=Crotalaria pallida TaxID=3830 RepID=A0AAN9HTL5_CROPI